MTKEETATLFKDIEIDSDGNIDYTKCVRILKSSQTKPDEPFENFEKEDEET